MAYKNIEDSRAAIRRHYYANKEMYLAKNKRRREELRRFINELKDATPCTDCGIRYPYYVMDFDHLRDKSGTISNITKANNLRALKVEIEKCEIVCANCHRDRTYKRLRQSTKS